MSDKAKAQARIVTMEDGTTANFGTRTKLLTAFDVPSATVTFRLFNGTTINWILAGIEALTDFQKTIYIYGAVEKVKSSLTSMTVDKLEAAINKQTTLIDSGVFNIRSSSETGLVKLSDLQKAYALAIALLFPERSHWANISDKDVMVEVLAAWESKTPTERNAIRRDPNVSLQLSTIQLQDGITSTLS